MLAGIPLAIDNTANAFSRQCLGVVIAFFCVALFDQNESAVNFFRFVV